MKRFTQLLFSLLLFIAWQPAAQSQDAVPENFDQWVNDGLEEWNIPGISAGLVKNGEEESFDKQYTLRPAMLQVGTYPTDYYRIVNFKKTEE